MKAKRTLIVISALAEWRATRAFHPDCEIQNSPYGAWFELQTGDRTQIFLNGGWGKISAAASAQYALQTWKPDLLINLGTCGGFEGQITNGEIILATETLVYDIVEQMGSPLEALEHYKTSLQLHWLHEPYPHPVQKVRLLSADRDICMEDLETLQCQYGGVAADWESGAIAWVAARNVTPCLILRGVTDLVGPNGGEAYANLSVFETRAESVMLRLLAALDAWVDCADL